MNFSESDLLALQAKGLKVHSIGNEYHAGRNPSPAHPTQYANRGMSLQNLVTQANEQYLQLGIAHIHDPGVPAKNVPDGHGGRKLIYQAATVDHLGSWQGKSIAFDDKATKIERLPAENVKEHQVEFLLNHQKIGGGLSFLLIGYSDYGRFFVVMIDRYLPYWTSRKGLKVFEAARIGMEVFAGRVCLDYLRAFEINKNIKGA
jgi:recombination protein U